MASNNVMNSAIRNTPRVVVTAMVSALAFGSLTGCSSSALVGSSPTAASYTQDGLARQATIEFDQNQTRGDYTLNTYSSLAQDSNLPDRWLSEAFDATAEIQARRAAGQAGLAVASADEFERVASRDASLAGAQSRFDVSISNVENLKAVYDAKLAEMDARTFASSQRSAAQAARNGASIAVGELEWRQQFEEMFAQAEQEWQAAQGEHSKMIAHRSAVESRGNAQLDKMREVARLTDDRARQSVAKLRAEANAASDQSQARVAALQESIQTTGTRFNAEAQEWRERAAATSDRAQAEAADLRAEADRIEATDADQQYALSLLAADLKFDSSVADAEQLAVDAETRAEEIRAIVDRIQGQADQSFEISKSDYESEAAAINKFDTQTSANIDFRRNEADRLERDARAEFVKAEAEARANAIIEASRHQQFLSDEELALIEAEATAEASRIQKKLYKQLAKEARESSSTLADKTKQREPNATNADGTPALTDASGKPIVLDPDRVAIFKSALAEVSAIRRHEEAAERALNATIAQRSTDLEMWFEQQVTAFESESERAETIARNGAAEVDELWINRASLLANAKAQRERTYVSSEANRRETLAKIAQLRSEAVALEKKSAASVRQYLANAEAADNNGFNSTSALAVKRDSESVRGSSEQQRLLAEAQALETSQQAVVAQMWQEIETSQQVLGAELAKLDRSAESFIAVAEATYDEQTFVANTFASVARTNLQQLAADHSADQAIAAAEAEYLDNLRNATSLAAQAAVARAAADAQFEFSTFAADDTYTRATIAAQAAMARSESATQFAIADALDQAVFAQFESRIVQTESERNRALAGIYLNDQQEVAYTTQRQAAALRYADLSAESLAKLSERAKAFRDAAQQNWDERLAFTPNYPTPATAQALYEQTLRDLGVLTDGNSFDTFNSDGTVITEEGIDLD